MSYTSRRAACIDCSRTLVIVAGGRCCTCYRKHRGRHQPRGECVECRRVMALAHGGRCWRCAEHRRNPETRWYKVRNVGFTTSQLHPTGPEPVATNLQPHERDALADVVERTRT